MSTIRRSAASLLAATLFAAPCAFAQSSGPVDPRLYAGLTWRNLGPFRAGRIAAVTGRVGQPGVFYVGLPAGGVWKTTSAGETWYPVFDAIKDVSSIGAVEVAPSDPNVIYVGTGDIITGGAINEGNGVYKSTDAGRTWRHVGLDAHEADPVDPRRPARSEHRARRARRATSTPRATTRGVFRSTDGGATWTQTLFVDDSTGVQKLARAYDVPNVIFATTVAHYPAPPPPAGQPRPRARRRPISADEHEALQVDRRRRHLAARSPAAACRALTGTHVDRRRDEHQRAARVSDRRLGPLSLRRRRHDVAADGRRRSAHSQRPGRLQLRRLRRSAESRRRLHASTPSSYKSTDGGNTFTGFKGAPGGDDPQQMWIDPTNGQRMLFGLDQGAIVTLDGGETWSSWYNQSTEQIYHLSVDNSFPYWVYGTQQDAGAIRTRIARQPRRDHAARLEPGLGLGVGNDRSRPARPEHRLRQRLGHREDLLSERGVDQRQPGADPARKLRTAFSQPIAFAPWNQHMLLAGFQSLWSTIDGGAHWTAMSPDLGVRTDGPTRPHRAGNAAPPGGAIEIDLGVDRRTPGMIWVGTNNGLIKVTRNGGKTWDGCVDPGIPNAQPRRSADRRRVALRSGDGVRGDRSAPHRRLHAVRLSHARLRQDVDADRRRPADQSAERQLRARHPRTTRRSRACCSPAPRAGCTSRSTTAITGSRSS